MYYKIVLILFWCFYSSFIFGQDQDTSGVRTLSLQEVVKMAKDQSPSALQAETRKENRYWRWRTHKSYYLPQLSIRGTLPNFSRQIIGVQQQDGSVEFRSVFNNNSTLYINLSQYVDFTGGTVFVNTRINRFDDFSKGEGFLDPITRYSGSPVEIGYRQPLFSYVNLKWEKRIEPLRFEESKREYVERIEGIARTATRLYFNLLLSQISLDIAKTNLANNDTIYEIAKGRAELGKIAENDLLQLELNVMNSRQAVAESQLDVETNSLRLKSYIGLQEDKKLNLKTPDNIPQFRVNEQMALQQARQNRSDAIEFRRRKVQASERIAEARGDSGLSADLFISFGLSNQSGNLTDLYVNPENQQVLRIGFSIPILDWGQTKAQMKTAQANQEEVSYTVAQDEIDFEQEIITHVNQFKMYRRQIKVSDKRDMTGQKRYDFAKKRYMIGKISITDLNIALQEKDEASRDYIQALRSFWLAYYKLRQLTLYDFEKDKKIKSEVIDINF